MFIFVEVKFRSEGTYIDALEQITTAQTARIRFTAQHYLLQHGLNQHQLKLRFDVITITGSNADLYWLKDAF
jgi:putative endonuclease